MNFCKLVKLKFLCMPITSRKDLIQKHIQNFFLLLSKKNRVSFLLAFTQRVKENENNFLDYKSIHVCRNMLWDHIQFFCFMNWILCSFIISPFSKCFYKRFEQFCLCFYYLCYTFTYLCNGFCRMHSFVSFIKASIHI